MKYHGYTFLVLAGLAELSISQLLGGLLTPKPPVPGTAALPAPGAGALPLSGAGAAPVAGSTSPFFNSIPGSSSPIFGNAPPVAGSSSIKPPSGSNTLTYIQSTIVEVRKHTANINSTVAYVSTLDINKKVSSIIVIRDEVRVICSQITLLNVVALSRWTESIPNLVNTRQQIAAAVAELVWEIVYTLRNAESRLQFTIWQLLGSESLVLLASFAQLFTILNVWIDGFLKYALGILYAQAYILNATFAGLYTYAADAASAFSGNITRLFTCAFS